MFGNRVQQLSFKSQDEKKKSSHYDVENIQMMSLLGCDKLGNVPF